MRRSIWVILLLAVVALCPAPTRAVEVEAKYKRFVHHRTGSQGRSPLGQLTQLLGGCDRSAPFVRSHALLIGVGRYRHLPSLDSPARDVDRLRNYLLNQGGFDEVIVLQDAAATPEAIRYFMEDYFPALFSNPKEAGRFLFYFSGHGATRRLPGGEERGYLRLANNREGYWSDAVGMDEIGKWAANVGGARHTLFLIDSCVSGLAGFEYKGRYDTGQSACDLIDLPGSLLLTAGQADEPALGGRDWGGSLFTEALLNGLQEGGGDANDDDLITSLELFNYMRAVVSRESHGAQHPGIKDLAPLGRRGGELFFLRSRPVRRPPAPPAAVEIKAESPAAVPAPPPASQPVPDPLDDDSPNLDLEKVNLRLQDLGFSEDVYFSPTGGNADLSYTVRLQLQRNAGLLKRHPQFTLVVLGHTSAPGTNESNLVLGERRANAVRDYLISYGVSAERIRTISYGEERPVCTEASLECQEQNTRVQMRVTGRVLKAEAGTGASEAEHATVQGMDHRAAGDSGAEGYAIYLTDGTTLLARSKYRRDAAGVIITMPDGSEKFLAMSQIDTERTERLKERAQIRQLLDSGFREEALQKAFDLALQLADALPLDPEAQHLAAEAAYRLSRWEDAAAFARRGGDPGNARPALLFYLGVAFHQAGEDGLASEYLRRALPGFESARVSSSSGRIPWLGISHRAIELRPREGGGIQGVLVDVRDPAGPVAKELDPLDVIEEVNGRPVIDAESFEREVLQAKSGSYLRFYVLRMKAGRSGRPQPAFVVLKVP